MRTNREKTFLAIVGLAAGATVTGALAEGVVNRNAAGQIVETYTEVEGKRQGAYASFYDKGQKKSAGNYADGSAVGKWTDYHPNGKVFRDTTFDKGQLTGPWSQYYDSGQLEVQGQAYGCAYGPNDLSSPLKTGFWTTYFENGTKASEGSFDKNNKTGPWVEYHGNGKKFREGMFQAGQLTGTWSQYYDSGRLETCGTTYGCAYGPNDLGSPLRTGLWVSYDGTGKITSAGIFEKNRFVRETSYSTDGETGVTKIPITRPDGSRAVVEVGPDGLISGLDRPQPEVAAPEDAADLVAMQEDPTTGAITTVRRNADGSKATYTGVRSRDSDGSERLIETDKDGNRIESVYAPDGTVTITRSEPGKGQTRTTTTRDGRITSMHTAPDGGTRTESLATDGTIVSERRNAAGELLETVRELPDGWRVHADPHGNTKRVYQDTNGETTTIQMDRSGNTNTTVTDAKGAVVSRETDMVAPMEPGREYFERVLNGTDWDALPASLKNRYAVSERAARQTLARRAEENAEENRRKVEEAKRAAESATLTEETRRKLDALQAEQKEADRIAALRKARVERQAEIEACYETGSRLQRQYDEAIACGDKAEAGRILALQDEHSEKSMRILEPTPEEARAMERLSDTHSRIANQITARAHEAAAARIGADASLQDAKETVTGVTKFVSIGSQMQQSTRAATRSADREKAFAQAKQEEIARRLAEPNVSAEERQILEELREISLVQEAGASELLAANGRITAAGYGLDAALLLTGGKVMQAGGQAATATVGAVRGVVSSRTAGSLVGRTTVNLADDAGRTLTMTSRMTAAERQALVEARTSTSMGEVTRIVGRDVLPGAAAPRTAIEVTRSELARLHLPGSNLTRAEIFKKAEIYRAREAARTGLRRAIEEGAAESVVAPLRATYQRLNGLIEEAKAAASATWRSP